MESILQVADSAAAGILTPMLVWILLSGADDLFLCAVFLWQRLTVRRADLPAVPEKRIAIFVPLWREHRVIGRMIEHNLSAIEYRNYHILLGVYPNDHATNLAARMIEKRNPRVRVCVCPHDGPTSKADCLNWIYQHMLLLEEEWCVRFHIVVTHDAEDLIHPDSLSEINRHIEHYDMVQVPVLPLPTPVWEFTHGVYCDEFAEYQMKDVAARPYLNSFLPSNGVGTGYSRKALERLAETQSNRVFEPACLTEDYENGIRLHRLGCPQVFLPLSGYRPIATREYFPRNFRAAVKQRTRWVMGIALQSWERHGWGRTAAERYWFWRDRKGLLGNPIGLVANVLSFYCLLRWIGGRCCGDTWSFERVAPPELLRALLPPTLSLSIAAMLVRSWAVGWVYGPPTALLVPLRAGWANLINSVATINALYRYLRARALHEPLCWLKTEHCYPSAATLASSPAIWTGREAHAGD